MAKEAIDKIVLAEEECKKIKEKANVYLKQTLDKAEQDRVELFDKKRQEANIAAKDIINQANAKAEEILKASDESGNKEVHSLRETVLEKSADIVSEIINMI